MKKHQDIAWRAVLDSSDTPTGVALLLSGATVTVRNSAGAVASIFSDNGVTPMANPFTTGADGEYGFYAANGTYSIEIAATGYAGETKAGIVLFDPAEAGLASAADFGARGGGVVDESAAVALALASGTVVFPQGTTYELGGADITISNSVNIIIGKGSKFQNGRLQFRPTDASKHVKINGHLRMVNGAIRIAGVDDVDWADPEEPSDSSITLICDDITVTQFFVSGSPALQIGNTRFARVGRLYADADGAGAGERGVYLFNNFDYHGESAEGLEYAMCVEVDATSTYPSRAMARCRLGTVRVNKTPASVPDVSGYHGFYFHGARDTFIGHVEGEGWGDTISSSATFKFRDNIDCKVARTNVDTFRTTSDDNYDFTLSTSRNKFGPMTCTESFSMVNSGTGVHVENEFDSLTTPILSLDGNGGAADGIILTGRCSIGGSSGVINSTALTFRNADVTLTSTPAFTAGRFAAYRTTFRQALSLTPNTASTYTLRHCDVIGAIQHVAAATTSAHTLDMAYVHATGAIEMNNTGSGVRTGLFRCVISDAAEPAAGLQPDVKTYYQSRFSDVAYS